MKHHLYALPVKGAAPLAIPATISCRRAILQEDDGGATQGIIVFYPDDNFTQGYTFAAGHEPVALGNDLTKGKGAGRILGRPAQVTAALPGQPGTGGQTLSAADTLVKVTSATATVTNLRVEEYD